MRLHIALLPALMLTVSCSGCSDNPTDPAMDAGVAAPAGDAGTVTPDTNAPVVPPEHELLGTWRFESPMEGSGVDGIAFFDSGRVAVYGRVAECQVVNQGTWTSEGDQLTINVGEQPGQLEVARCTERTGHDDDPRPRHA